MRKAIFAAVSLVASAEALSLNAGIHYAAQNIEFDEITPSLTGLFAALYLGDENLQHIGYYSLSDSDSGIDYSGIETGVGAYFYESGRFGSRLSLALGYGHAEVPWFKNRNKLISLGAGVGADYRLLRNMKLDAELGYKGYFDASGEVQCLDGHESDRMDVGACAQHGGVNYYRN